MKFTAIHYITDYPVGYHHEALKFIAGELQTEFTEFFVSDFVHPVSGRQKYAKTATFLCTSLTYWPNFLRPFLKLKPWYVPQDGALVVFHGYNNINIVWLILWLSLAKKKKNIAMAFRGESTDSTSRIRNGLAKWIAEKLKSALLRRFDIFFYIGQKNLKYYRAKNLPGQMIPWSYTRLPTNEGAKRPVVPTTRFTMVFVGRLEPVKGLHEFIASLTQFAERTPHKLTLKIVGDGTEKSMLSAACSSLPKNLTVKFEGFLSGERLVEAYRNSDVFVLPSLYEPYGMVVAEAAMHALPLLLSDAVGARDDFLIDGKNGYCFADQTDLFGALDKLLAAYQSDMIKVFGNQSELLYKKNSLNRTVEELRLRYG